MPPAAPGNGEENNQTGAAALFAGRSWFPAACFACSGATDKRPGGTWASAAATEFYETPGKLPAEKGIYAMARLNGILDRDPA